MTLHEDLYMSPDCTIISDHSNLNVQKWPLGTNRFLKFHGVTTDKCIRNYQIVQYDITCEFTLKQALDERQAILEFGLAERAKIDLEETYSFTLGSDAWTFLVIKSFEGDINLEAWHDNTITPLIVYYGIDPGDKLNNTYSIIVDRQVNMITFYYKIMDFKFTFSGVTSAVELCPTFSVKSQVSGLLHGDFDATIRVVNSKIIAS